MSRFTVRESCGTIRGVLAHQAAAEDWCGWCRYAERVASLAAERFATAPAPDGFLPPVTAGDAEAHRLVLEAAVADFESKHGGESRERWLRSVS